MNKTPHLIAGLAGIALIVAAFFLWRHQQAPEPTLAVTPSPAASAVAAESPATAASAPAILHPIETPMAEQPAASAPSDLAAALGDLFDRTTLLSMFQTDDLARRFVATVDNLGRSHASVALWPVNPTAGRFGIETRDGVDVLGTDNAQRYAPFIQLVETVDLPKAVAMYRRLYPQFQQAYQDLGYPKGYFNDRLVEVIDQLLATPDVSGPLKIRTPQFSGPVQPERPWLMYEFEDPALQSLTAGQKIMLRMGPVNERRMKTRLKEFRALVTAGDRPR